MIRLVLIVAAVTGISVPLAAQSGQPVTAKERIVLHTIAGPLVLALYPEVAPRHVEQITKLVRLGAYNGTHFYRVDPSFLIQVGNAEDRRPPLSPQQKEAIQKIPAEWSDLKHVPGAISMARWGDDPDSGETSFCILLAAAPHMDGKYTIFGRLESGRESVEKMLAIPRDGTTPKTRVEITKAEVVESAAELVRARAQALRASRPVTALAKESVQDVSIQPGSPSSELLLGTVFLMALISLVGFFLSSRTAQRFSMSLFLINAFVGGVTLFALLGPVSASHPGLAMAVFFGLLGVIRLMGYFESAR